MSYLSVAGALMVAMLALILWAASLPLLALLKVLGEVTNGLLRVSRKLLKWI